MDVITNGCSKHETVEFEVLRRERNESNGALTLDLRKADFGLFAELVWQVPLKAALKGKENLAGLDDSILQSQEPSLLMEKGIGTARDKHGKTGNSQQL